MSASSWIRGVNLGGWLLAERFITPYLFAVNSCQLRGDFCFHPDQIDSPPTSSRQHVYCDLNLCQPHLIDDPTESVAKDYPMDEKSLLGSFDNKAVAKQYMTFHWENFVQKDDVQFLSENNVEYVKVPMPHYVMNDILDNEPWVDGQWLFFLRFADGAENTTSKFGSICIHLYPMSRRLRNANIGLRHRKTSSEVSMLSRIFLKLSWMITCVML